MLFYYFIGKVTIYLTSYITHFLCLLAVKEETCSFSVPSVLVMPTTTGWHWQY